MSEIDAIRRMLSNLSQTQWYYACGEIQLDGEDNGVLASLPGAIGMLLNEVEMRRQRMDEAIALCNEGHGDMEVDAYLMHIKAILDDDKEALKAYESTTP